MDHVGDMARYINQGLQAIGYPGAGQLTRDDGKWDPDAITHNPDGTLTMHFVWGKDSGFEITIRDLYRNSEP